MLCPCSSGGGMHVFSKSRCSIGKSFTKRGTRKTVNRKTNGHGAVKELYPMREAFHTFIQQTTLLRGVCEGRRTETERRESSDTVLERENRVNFLPV